MFAPNARREVPLQLQHQQERVFQWKTENFRCVHSLAFTKLYAVVVKSWLKIRVVSYFQRTKVYSDRNKKICTCKYSNNFMAHV